MLLLVRVKQFLLSGEGPLTHLGFPEIMTSELKPEG